MTKVDLNKLSESIKTRFEENETIQSFQTFLNAVVDNPHKYCRNSAQYVKDVFDHFGYYEVKSISGENVRRWRIFDEFGPVYGQETAQNQIYNYVSSFAENRVNKIILLHGPNGSAKTTLVNAIMRAVERYSKLPEGAVFTFNWIFSDKGEKEVGLGFNSPNNPDAKETLAHTKHEDITFKLVCAMKDNPLLLIPRAERAELLTTLGFKRPHHLFDAELSQKSKETYEQLAISFNGDWMKILRHVQIERFYFSKLFRKGLISIDPCPNVDAHSRALNLERSYRIPRVLAMSSMYEPYGDLVDANRGICELSEIFKRRVDENKYLLTTAEWGTISLPGFTAQLDCVIFATDNEKNLSIFKTHPDWPSFNGRFAYVKVPYMLKWSDEEKACRLIFQEHIKSHIAPHTSEILSLWAVMTRIRKSQRDLANKLSHIEKAELLDKGVGPSSWSQKDRLQLEKDVKKLATEHEDSRDRVIAKGITDASYEGRSGASYRDVENIVVEAIHKREFLSPLAIFQTIEEIIKNESFYEFVTLHLGNKEGSVYEEGYLDPESILREVKTHYRKQIRRDLRNSAGLVSDDEYDRLFMRYVNNVKAWTKSEKILNPQTGKYEAPSEVLMRRVEEKMGIDDSESRERRKGLVNKIAAWALKNDIEGGIPYKQLFSDLLDQLKRSNDTEQREQLERLQKLIIDYGTDDWQRHAKSTPKTEREHVTQTIDNMKGLGYTDASLKEAVSFLMKCEESSE